MYNAVYYDEYGIHLNLRGLEKWSEKVDERLAAIEENIKPEVVFDVEKMKVLGDEIGIISGSYVDEKLYNKLEEKHEADCRLISEYDLEIKKLEKRNAEQNDIICTLYSKYASEEKEHLRCEAVIKDLKFDVEKAKDWEKRYNELEYMYEKKDAECNGLEDKYKRQGAVLKKKYDEIAELMSKYKDLEEKLENFKSQVEVISRENIFLKTQLNKFESGDDECCD